MPEAVRPFSVSVLILFTLVFSPRAQESTSLPREKILQAYKGGDLDSVLVYIKNGRAKPIFRDREDSLLAFKCLGVIYAADPARREKGRYFFNLLLWMDPRATITDLYPGESVRQVFREVREEYLELHPQAAQPEAANSEIKPPPAQDTAGVAPKAVSARASVEPHKSSHIWWWVAGGTVATAVAGTAVYFLIYGTPKIYTVHD